MSDIICMYGFIYVLMVIVDRYSVACKPITLSSFVYIH